MPELNLVELEVSQVENGVKVFQAAGTPCTKAQRQERIQGKYKGEHLFCVVET